MMWGTMPKTLTGVGATLIADHRSRDGQIHGHTWEITAWFEYRSGSDAKCLRFVLERILEPYQGKCLPDRIAWGEDLARHIALEIAGEYRAPVQVDVTRQAERIYARWVA